jgi:hypothetical protein
MRVVTLTVEIKVVVGDNVEPNDITLNMPIEQTTPMVDGKVVGTTIGYTTQEYFGE